MQNRNRVVLLLVLLGVLFAVGVSYFFWEETRHEKALVLYGNIDIRQVDLGFRVFGKLKTMRAEEGDLIAKGDLLAELDPQPYENVLKEAQERVRSLNNQADLAQAQLKRRNLLVEDRSVSEEDFQQAFYQEKTLQANLEEAKAQQENARIQFEDTQLHSPAEGVVFTRIREPGTILKAGDPVYSLSVSSPIWARTYVSEIHLGQIHPGMSAKIYTDTPSNPVYTGHVGFISPIAEFTPKNVETPDLRTNLVYQLRVFIDNPDKGLRQGMPVTIELPLK